MVNFEFCRIWSCSPFEIYCRIRVQRCRLKINRGKRSNVVKLIRLIFYEFFFTTLIYDFYFFFLTSGLNNWCENKFRENNEKSCSWSRNRVSNNIDFRAVWPRNGHAARVGVNHGFRTSTYSQNSIFVLEIFNLEGRVSIFKYC